MTTNVLSAFLIPSKILLTSCIMIFCFTITIFTLPSYGADQMLTTGETAPDFTLPDLAGKQYSLFAHKGEDEYTMLLFWGVWCPYCREIMVMLSNMHHKLRAQNISIVTISLRESPTKISLFVNKLDSDIITLVDEWGELKNPYKIKDVPLLVVLNKDLEVISSTTTTSSKMVSNIISNISNN